MQRGGERARRLIHFIGAARFVSFSFFFFYPPKVDKVEGGAVGGGGGAGGGQGRRQGSQLTPNTVVSSVAHETRTDRRVNLTVEANNLAITLFFLFPPPLAEGGGGCMSFYCANSPPPPTDYRPGWTTPQSRFIALDRRPPTERRTSISR